MTNSRDIILPSADAYLRGGYVTIHRRSVVSAILLYYKQQTRHQLEGKKTLESTEILRMSGWKSYPMLDRVNRGDRQKLLGSTYIWW